MRVWRIEHRFPWPQHRSTLLYPSSYQSFCDSSVWEALRISTTGLHLEAVPFDSTNQTLLCDVSLGTSRPIIPAAWQRHVFDLVHNLSHLSIQTSCKLIANKFVWRGMHKQVSGWAKSCILCRQAKVHHHVHAPPEKFVIPHRRFEHINIDIVGPLLPSQGFAYLLTIVDHFSRWPEAIPLVDISTASCARALVSHWIVCFGLPSDISSDRGAQFISRMWSAMTELLIIKLHCTTLHHPQAN